MNPVRLRAVWLPLLCSVVLGGTFACKKPDPYMVLTKQAEDEKTRSEALPKLAALQRDDATALVIDYLRQPGPWQTVAAESLGGNKCEAAVEPLMDTLHAENKGDEADALNVASIAALQALGANAAADKLLRAVQNGTPKVRAAAVTAIGALQFGGAAPLLVQLCFDHSQPEVVRASIIALGQLKSELAAPALTQALFFDDLRRDAENSLTSLGDAAIGSLVQAVQRKSPLVENVRNNQGQPLGRGAVEARVAPVLGAIKTTRAQLALAQAGDALSRAPATPAQNKRVGPDATGEGLTAVVRALAQANVPQARTSLQAIAERTKQHKDLQPVAEAAELALAKPPASKDAQAGGDSQGKSAL